MAVVAMGGVAALAVAACATGGSRVDTSDDNNITETTSSSGGNGGAGGALVTSSNTTSTSTTSTSTGMGGTGGMDDMCDEDPCRVMTPQCGCPTDQKCTLMPGVWTRGCRTEGSGVHGDPCDNDLDCAAGTLCIFVGSLGTCRDFCESDADCQSPGGLCQVELGVVPGTEKWCSDDCDPITNSGCTAPGSKCELLNDSVAGWYTQCVPAGAGTQGASCSSYDDCAAGYGCLTVNSVSSCHQFCNVNSPVCGSGGTCLNFEAPAPIIGTTEYGGCD